MTLSIMVILIAFFYNKTLETTLLSQIIYVRRFHFSGSVFLENQLPRTLAGYKGREDISPSGEQISVAKFCGRADGFSVHRVSTGKSRERRIMLQSKTRRERRYCKREETKGARKYCGCQG